MLRGTGQLGTIIVNEYMVGKWGREREREWEREGDRKLCVLRRGSEEQADVGSLLVIKGLSDVQAWAVAKGHVWVHGPNAAMVVYVD